MSNLSERLAKMPPDLRRATLQDLPTHLAEAANAERLHFLLANFDFIEAKVSELAPQELIEDYNLAKSPQLPIPEERRKSLRLIQGALRLSSNTLNQDKKQLPEQLLGRLMDSKDYTIQSLTDHALKRKTGIWLRPLVRSLISPHESLLRNLQSGHNQVVNAMVVMPDGQRVISASNDNTLKIWDLESGAVLSTLEGHTDWVKAVAITPDGRLAISASRDEWH
ncbi:hypothetical protein [Tolypothrix sp. NIES-4075]|uniref:hypothetical protein n=1 Tax=Tolypothrix sp. NIES-4075 TaxID=2005459 RepID=UPI00135CDF21|nr:hypothetical protein [Tolypothrix sp. NIES-4075]